MMTAASDLKRLFLTTSIVLMAGCRLVITTDDTGSLVSTSGAFDCDQSECAFEITEKVTDTFTAIPAEGYRFVRWTGPCGRSPLPQCDLTLQPLDEEFMHLDGDIELSAKFERTTLRREWHRDEDGDHWGDPTKTRLSRNQPEGYVINDGDCDDSNAEIRPAFATEKSF